MLSSRKAAIITLIVNLAGSVALFFSFQATASNFRYISTPDGRSALCVSRFALIVVDPANNGTGVGMGCPAWDEGKPAAVVSIEKPGLAITGFCLILLGFAMQAFSVPSAKTERELRLEIKRLQAEDKSKSQPK